MLLLRHASRRIATSARVAAADAPNGSATPVHFVGFAKAPTQPALWYRKNSGSGWASWPRAWGAACSSGARRRRRVRGRATASRLPGNVGPLEMKAGVCVVFAYEREMGWRERWF